MSKTTLASINDWFKVAKPEPTMDDAQVQIGCHYEQVAEMMEAMFNIGELDVIETLVDTYKYGEPYSVSGPYDKSISDEVRYDKDTRKKLLGALTNQIVTAIGVAHMLGMDITGALVEANRSNWSKFVDGKPVFNDNGTIIEGEGYTPQDLTPFI